MDVTPLPVAGGARGEADGITPGGGHPTGGDGPGDAGRRPRNLRAIALGALVAAALGFVLLRGLGNATLFFYNVDEAVARRADLEDDRFRLQGTVEPASVARSEEGATFTLAYGGAVAPVRHRGDLPQLFEPGIPVVLEGRWEGDRFESDRMLVKHSEVYTAENPERVDGYELPGGGAGAEPAGAGPANGADPGTGRP